MLMRIIGIFIFMAIFAVGSAKLLGINVLDIFFLAAIISPAALLRKKINEEQSGFSYNGSIFFRKFISLFKITSFILMIFFVFAIYYYFENNGFVITAILLVITFIVQGAYYALIKMFCFTEFLLIILEIIGLILFYMFVL